MAADQTTEGFVRYDGEKMTTMRYSGESKVTDAERAKIVAWLRERASNPDSISDRAFSIIAEEIADAIEAGEYDRG